VDTSIQQDYPALRNKDDVFSVSFSLKDGSFEGKARWSWPGQAAHGCVQHTELDFGRGEKTPCTFKADLKTALVEYVDLEFCHSLSVMKKGKFQNKMRPMQKIRHGEKQFQTALCRDKYDVFVKMETFDKFGRIGNYAAETAERAPQTAEQAAQKVELAAKTAERAAETAENAAGKVEQAAKTTEKAAETAGKAAEKAEQAAAGKAVGKVEPAENKEKAGAKNVAAEKAAGKAEDAPEKPEPKEKECC